MISYKSPQSNLVGFYRGVVIKHLSNGCCKLWIPSVHPEEWADFSKADLLPTAEQASSLSFGAANGLGIYTYPNIGSVVWCFFENCDQHLPVYFAASLCGPDGCNNWNKALAMPGSHPDDAYLHKIHVKNTDIEIYETGVLKIKTENGDNNCQINLDADGNVQIQTTSTITLKSKQILVDAETQIDMKAPNVKISAPIHFSVESPAIDLDSTKGHTVVKSRTTTCQI